MNYSTFAIDSMASNLALMSDRQNQHLRNAYLCELLMPLLFLHVNFTVF